MARSNEPPPAGHRWVFARTITRGGKVIYPKPPKRFFRFAVPIDDPKGSHR